MLADDDELVPRGRDALVAEALAAARRYDDPDVGVAAVRALRRRELFRTAVAELLGLVGGRRVRRRAVRHRGRHDRRRARARAARRARRGAGRRCRRGSSSSRWAASAAASSASPATPTCSSSTTRCPAPTSATRTRPRWPSPSELRRLLMIPTPDPALEVDAVAAPRGAQRTAGAHPRRPTPRTTSAGPRPWEAQALLRAEPVAGDDGPRPHGSSR